MDTLKLDIPDSEKFIRPGNIIQIGRFNTDQWIVCYGWYSWASNRPVCGWYLKRIPDMFIKPIQLTDLDDIYLIKQ